MPPWLIELPTCTSTNTWVLDHAQALAHGAVVWTRQQTAGRGRGSNRWLAPEGVLTATVVLIQPDPPPQVALAAGLAVVHACEDLQPGLDLRLKWPNDVLRQGCKLAGVLCERADAVLAVGIGLNVDPRWDLDAAHLPFAVGERRPAALAEAGPPPPMVDLLEGLRRYLLEAAGLLRARGFTPLAQAWRQRDALLGRQLVIDDGGRRLSGISDGIDDHGRLRLRQGDEVLACTGGHVEAIDD
jgi:BirA family biotin operon repressor/biotin-[acetyl-CoA-carboxylase] ligase